MALLEMMNKYLANQEVMYLKLHNLHWYIQGNSFFTLHGKFEELYDQTADMIDEVAERILALGGMPVGSMKNALAQAAVKELEDQPIDTAQALHQLITDVEYWIKDTGAIMQQAQQDGDDVTADIFTGYLKAYQKLLWMLKAYSK